MRNKNLIYCVFRIILDTYGITMRNENHIYCVFRIILDTYGNIMKINHRYCVFRSILDNYEIIIIIKIIYIVSFELFRHLWNYNEKTYKLCFSDYFRHLWNYNAILKSYILWRNPFLVSIAVVKTIPSLHSSSVNHSSSP